MLLRAQLAEQSSTLLDQHPSIKELRAQIADSSGRCARKPIACAFARDDAKLTSSKSTSSASCWMRSSAGGLDQRAGCAAARARARRQIAARPDGVLFGQIPGGERARQHRCGGADARIISFATVSTTPSWPKKVPTILVAALATFVLTCTFNHHRGAAARGGDDRSANHDAEKRRSRHRRAPRDGARNGRCAAFSHVKASRALRQEIPRAGERDRAVTIIGTDAQHRHHLAAIKLARSLAQKYAWFWWIFRSPHRTLPPSLAIRRRLNWPSWWKVVQASAALSAATAFASASGCGRPRRKRSCRDPGLREAFDRHRGVAPQLRSRDRRCRRGRGAHAATLCNVRATCGAGGNRTGFDSAAVCAKRLLKAGFANVSIVQDRPPDPELGADRAKPRDPP